MRLKQTVNRLLLIASFLAFGGFAQATIFNNASGATNIAAISGPDTTSNFTCNSKTGVCNCQGKTDCFDLGKSGLCVEGTEMDGNKPNSLTCEFRFKRQRVGPVQE